jgi:hypothetical protein
VRLKAQEKKVDHMERAKRLEEIPLLREQHEDLKAERKQVLASFPIKYLFTECAKPSARKSRKTSL